jgi:hypothetical protein
MIDFIDQKKNIYPEITSELLAGYGLGPLHKNKFNIFSFFSTFFETPPSVFSFYR